MFVNLLATEWFPSVPGLVQRLRCRPARHGRRCRVRHRRVEHGHCPWLPRGQSRGLDLDEQSVAEARASADRSGIADRLSFEVRDAADPGLAGTFDLVCAFETLHDMCDPIGALRAMRALRREGGTVLVVDERVADSFTTDVEDGERFQWGWSALHCLPCAMATEPAAGTGTIMRTPTLREYAAAAGFADLEVLPIQNDFWRFYRLNG